MTADTKAITDEQVEALVRRMVDVALNRVFEFGRISWEDLPELGQYDWERVTHAFDAKVGRISAEHDRVDVLGSIDRRELWERFQ